MNVRTHRPLPEKQAELLRRAEHTAWLTLALMGAVTVMMYLAMGESQAMKTAWVEDVLSLVPPVAFLLAARFARQPPDREYINGRLRAFDVNFLAAAVALTGVGALLVYESMSALLTQTHPSIGAIRIGDQLIWQGWVMIAALAVSAVPPMWLGRRKLALARALHLKPLHTDADMNKADWMTALTGIVGILGVGAGWWWADAAAALVISGSVLHDGVSNLRHAMRDMHDARPETTERSDQDPLVARVRDAVAALDWVAECDVRLHEEGPRLSGVVQVTPRDQRALAARLAEAQRVVRDVHWRIDDIAMTLRGVDADEAAHLPADRPGRGSAAVG